jgi:hypothetical protein
MKQIGPIDILKAFNECVLGMKNEYWPKLVMTYDHDGELIFFLIFEGEDDRPNQGYPLQAEDAVRRLNNMTGYLKYGVTREIGTHFPIFMELNA